MEVLQRTANRGSISTGGYEIDNSLKFEADNSEQLSRDVSSTGSRTTATVSMWIKRTELGAAQYLFTYGNTDNDNGRTLARFQSDDTLRIMGGNTVWLNTNRVFRDTSAWYHIVIVFDTTSGTADNRTRMYINGVEETSFSTRNNPSQNFIHGLNFQKQVIGYNSVDGGSYFSGYMTEIVHQDGTASAPTDFGEYDSDTGIWIPKDVNGVASGTNGFYLDFEDNTSAGKDTSGNNNNFSDTNLNAADHATDTPTNNFATISVTAQYTDSARIINQSNITNGATKITKTDVGAWGGGVGTMGVKSGKWYYEGKIYDIDDLMLGFSTFSGNIGANASPHGIGTNIVYYGGGASGSYWFYHVDGTTTSNSSNRGTVWSVGDIIGIALDLDNSKVNFYVNGSLAGSNNTNVNISDVTNEINSTGDFLVPFTGMWRSTIEFNFGGYTVTSISSAESDENGYGTFEYAPPSGYYALCTKNLAEYG